MKNIENDNSAVVTAKLLAIPSVWEDNDERKFVDAKHGKEAR